MNRSGITLRVGDWVEVRGEHEIGRTLDADGALDGLPFMPEMIPFCGRRFRLLRQARKACVECLTPAKDIYLREFRGKNVWVVDGLRCTGGDHDGCQRGCLLYWRGEWLRKIGPRTGLAGDPVNRNHEELRGRLSVQGEPGRYFCQSTQLERATKPLTRWGRIRLCVADVRSGSVGILDMLASIVQPMFWKTLHRFIPRHVVGKSMRTPVAELGLKRGDLVEVKSAHAIALTLNDKGCSRGLRFDRGLNRFCGTRYIVRERLDRMIVESSGRMIQMQGTVTLEGSTCQCHLSAIGGCSRQEPVYWREVWLEQIQNSRVLEPDGRVERQGGVM
jgi:hypothetical protein